MNIIILVFSPYGNTLKVSKSLARIMASNNLNVELIDITRNIKLWVHKQFNDFFTNLNQHDVLCIGAPVYAHLFPKNVLDFIEELPFPDGEKLGEYVIPFVTYGGVSSGIALHDVSQRLIKRKRINILGMKVNSYHSLSQNIRKQNVGVLGQEINTLLIELVHRLINLNLDDQQEYSDSFNYQINYQKPKEPEFSKIKIDSEKCKMCKKCLKRCPVQRIEFASEYMTFNQVECINCGECYFNCKFAAIDWNIIKFKPFLERVGELSEPVNESKPYSAIYPLEK